MDTQPLTAPLASFGGRFYKLFTKFLNECHGVAATAPGQAAIPAQRDADSSSAAAPFVRAGGATYRGRDVRHEVIDGLAIHGCDMVLGTVGELAAEYRRQRSTKPSTGARPVRRGLSPVEDRASRRRRIPRPTRRGSRSSTLRNITLGLSACSDSLFVTEHLAAPIDEWTSRTLLALGS